MQAPAGSTRSCGQVWVVVRGQAALQESRGGTGFLWGRPRCAAPGSRRQCRAQRSCTRPAAPTLDCGVVGTVSAHGPPRWGVGAAVLQEELWCQVAGVRPQHTAPGEPVRETTHKEKKKVRLYHSHSSPWKLLMGFAGDKPLLCLLSCSSFSGGAEGRSCIFCCSLFSRVQLFATPWNFSCGSVEFDDADLDSLRQASGTPQPVLRERKSSISSISGRDDLMDYHRRQREERLREQEMERLVISFFIWLDLTVSLSSFLETSSKDTCGRVEFPCVPAPGAPSKLSSC